jgi:hypothetical protein
MKFFIFCKIILFISLNTSITSLRHYYNKKNSLLLNSSKKNDEQCIISSKNNNVYCNSSAKLFISENNFLNNKKLITISPGGFKGFYLLGILTYLKENYDLNNFIYSGASAGSWNGLFMCYKGDPLEFAFKLLDSNIKKAKSITELEIFLKYLLLSSCKEEEFDLRRLFIGVTTFKNFVPRKNIFSDFNSLEDAINCCIASSHIPLITGGLTNKYHDMFTFDGGFCDYPYLLNDNFVLHVSPSMWSNLNNNNVNSIKRSIGTIKQFSEFFSISKNNLLELFDDGYQDAKNHKKHFDELFIINSEVDDDGIIEI